MIELRHLSHLLVACGHDNLTRAAKDLCVAPSTLSASFKALETELGCSLFKRSGSGLYPRACGRWLVRAGLPLLLLERHVRRRLQGPDEPTVLRIHIGLKFTIGRVCKALLHAIAETEKLEPLLLIHPIWIDDDPVPFDAGWPEDVGLKSAGEINLRMVPAGLDLANDEVALMHDRWVLAYRTAGDSGVPPDLASRSVYVPAVSRGLSEVVEAHVAECGFARVRLLSDHPGSLPRLMSEHPEGAFLIPASTISERLGLINTSSTPLHRALNTTLIGRVDPNNGAAKNFLDRLKNALAEPEGATSFAPLLTSRRVRYFNLTHKLKSVSAAARLANVAQPALSEQLRKLELTLQARLFDRRNCGVSPTPDSARFAPVSQALENGLHQIKVGAMSSSTQDRRLILGVLPSVSQHGLLINRIAEAIMALKSLHPETRITVQEAPNGTLQDWVVRGQVGLSIVETGPPQLPRQSLGASEELALITNPQFHALAPGPFEFANLARLPLALPTSQFGLRQLLDSAARSQRIELRPCMEIDALPMLIAILRHQPICTILPPSAVRPELESGELTAHPLVEPSVVRRLFVIYSGDRSLTEPERQFVTVLRERLTEGRRSEGGYETPAFMPNTVLAGRRRITGAHCSCGRSPVPLPTERPSPR